MNEDLKEPLASKADELKRSSGNDRLSVEDETMIKELSVVVDLLLESINLKKFNLIGCKMKVYAERMKDIK